MVTGNSAKILVSLLEKADFIDLLKYTRKNAQVVTSLQTSCSKFTGCQQVVFALLVPSFCNKLGTSCYQLVTSLMALSDLLQGCFNKSVTIMM